MYLWHFLERKLFAVLEVTRIDIEKMLGNKMYWNICMYI